MTYRDRVRAQAGPDRVTDARSPDYVRILEEQLAALRRRIYQLELKLGERELSRKGGGA